MGSLHTFFLSENICHIVDPEYSQNTKNRFAQAGGAVFFVDRRDSRFMPRRGKSPAGHHVVTDCTGSRRLFYLKSHLESVPSLLLSKMQTFHWFAFWLFLQRPKPVGHPAFLSILRKAGCPFLMFNIFLSGAAMRHAFLTVFSIRQQYAGNEALCGYLPLRASPDSAGELQSETQRPSTDGCCVIV